MLGLPRDSGVRDQNSSERLLHGGIRRLLHDIIDSSMIQLTKTGITGAINVEELAQQFEQHHVFRLPRLLNADLLEIISPKLNQCIWTTQDDGSIAREAGPADPAPMHILNFALNTSDFLDLMRGITRCDSIGIFGGRVYKMAPSADHFYTWHADI